MGRSKDAVLDLKLLSLGTWLYDKLGLTIYRALILSLRRSLSYRIQIIDLQSKSKDWFRYDRDLRHEIVIWGCETYAS